MARRGRQLVAGRYDWSVLAKKLEAIWLEQAQSGETLMYRHPCDRSVRTGKDTAAGAGAR